jgi:hypothetical protein
LTAEFLERKVAEYGTLQAEINSENVARSENVIVGADYEGLSNGILFVQHSELKVFEPPIKLMMVQVFVIKFIL